MTKLNDHCGVDPSKYVVLDVETNGLSSIRDDLLSISIYKPDTGEMYNRFLPLELNSEVVTTDINGIKTKDLRGLSPLSQDEVDDIIRVFELKTRTILTYGGIDERFLVKYFKRHNLQGIDYFAFYNFKHEIISSRFSEGNITKDNLCKIYGIENVQSVHSGSNDCVLEWKLFERMNGHRLFVTNDKVFEFNNEYFVPASYIASYPNLKYYLPNLPQITCESRTIFSLPVSAKRLRIFPTNFNGMILEHLINSMLNVQTIHSDQELLDNKKKLKYIGRLPSTVDVIPMDFNSDGSMTAIRPQDQALASDINMVIKTLKVLFRPLVDFIRNDIFNGREIKSQELVVHHENRILALCDLSTEDAVLEIKATSFSSPQSYAEQLYYEANGRKCYVLLTNRTQLSKMVSYEVHEVVFSVKEHIDPQQARYEKAKKRIETDEIELLSFVDIKSPVKLKCKVCGSEWSMSYNLARKHRPCPNCFSKMTPIKSRSRRSPLTDEEKTALEESKRMKKYLRYKTKLEEKSKHQVTALTYENTQSPARAKCLICEYEWEARADHLLARPRCPVCKKRLALLNWTMST